MSKRNYAHKIASIGCVKKLPVEGNGERLIFEEIFQI